MAKAASCLRVDLSVGAAIGEVVTGDLNTDGHLDVATTGDGYGGVVVFLSDGAGSYLPPSSCQPTRYAAATCAWPTSTATTIST